MNWGLVGCSLPLHLDSWDQEVPENYDCRRSWVEKMNGWNFIS